MQVVVTKDQLVRNRACSAYMRSPEWDAEAQALVYTNWSKTVKRLLSTRKGISFLDWLVIHKLVPMTAEDLARARANQENEHGV